MHYNTLKRKNRRSSSLTEERYALFEMANLQKEETGLPYNVWIDSIGCSRNINHNSPSFKVDVDEDGIPEVPVSIDMYNPCVLESRYKEFKHKKNILVWAKKNYDVLIAHWEHRITDRQALILLANNE